jgi:hypothetical protein
MKICPVGFPWLAGNLISPWVMERPFLVHGRFSFFFGVWLVELLEAMLLAGGASPATDSLMTK